MISSAFEIDMPVCSSTSLNRRPLLAKTGARKQGYTILMQLILQGGMNRLGFKLATTDVSLGKDHMAKAMRTLVGKSCNQVKAYPLWHR